MLSDEERELIEKIQNENKIGIYELIRTFKREGIENFITVRRKYIDIMINLIEKQSKEIEELKREKETNQQMIQLAETQILGYDQGYKDGLNKETTATAIVARERENQIIYEGMKHKLNMEWVLKIKAKIEEINNEKLGYSEDEYYLENEQKGYAIDKMQSLLEKE